MITSFIIHYFGLASQQQILAVIDPRSGRFVRVKQTFVNTCRLIITNLANFREARFWTTSRTLDIFFRMIASLIVY